VRVRPNLLPLHFRIISPEISPAMASPETRPVVRAVPTLKRIARPPHPPCPRVSGSVKRTDAPPAVRFSAQMRPPYVSTIVRAIERPSPVP
jgi:hypothetical protein